MAGTQTVAAVAQSDFAVEVSTNGSAWTAICGEAVTLTVSGGEQPVGEAYTACGEGAIVIGSNKHQPYEITVTAIYTETATTEAFDFIHDRFMGTAKTLAVRWAPKGGITTVVGNKVFNTSVSGTAVAAVPMLRCLPPAQDASSANPAVFEFAVRSPLIYESVSATS